MHLKMLSKIATTGFLSVALPLTLLLSTPSTQALQSDQNQPIEIESDRALRDEQRGVTIYEGAVIVIQGTMRIDADKVTIYTVGENASRIVCEGQPAQFQQQINPDEGLTHGEASVINYDRTNENIELNSNASVTKADGTLLTGNSIEYNLTSQKLRAESKQGERVHMVIQPQSKDEK